MSKPLIVSELVSPAINMHTTDGSGAVVLDQAEASSNIVVVSTNALAKNIVVTNDPTTAVKLTGGNIFLDFPSGNFTATGSIVQLNGSFVTQTMLTATISGTLDPANALYNELNDTDIPALQFFSRVYINPNALGTTVNSLFISAGNPNVDGRKLWIQNIGTAVGQTLVLNDLSPAGTVGGKFRAPTAAFSILPGGGLSLMFDQTANVWFLQVPA